MSLKSVISCSMNFSPSRLAEIFVAFLVPSKSRNSRASGSTRESGLRDYLGRGKSQLRLNDLHLFISGSVPGRRSRSLHPT
jgi:hypothetical protein